MCFYEKRPATTVNNVVSERGDKFVTGRNRKGKLNLDLLATCDHKFLLDEGS
jgi:hypothetical protein